jgi:hypothetical protein
VGSPPSSAGGAAGRGSRPGTAAGNGHGGVGVGSDAWQGQHEGLFGGDDGKPLFCVIGGAGVEDDGGVPLEPVDDMGGGGGGAGTQTATPAPSGGGGGGLSRADSEAGPLGSAGGGGMGGCGLGLGGLNGAAEAVVVAPVPEMQFLNKNSRFRSAGRTFKSFRLRVVATWAPLPGSSGGGGAGAPSAAGAGGPRNRSASPNLSAPAASTGETLAAPSLDSEPFKVTTKKGYDGCRKADYLNAREPLTDKAFAALGETTIANLKARFPGAASTVGDLAALVDAAAGDAPLENKLRETLNMARDADKWRALRKALRERVVRDDATPRVWSLPLMMMGAMGGGGGGVAGQHQVGVGLLYRAQKGAVDLAEPVGVLLGEEAAAMAGGGVMSGGGGAGGRNSSAGGGGRSGGRNSSAGGGGADGGAPPLRAFHLSEGLQMAAGAQVDQLRRLAALHWRSPRHPGWRAEPRSLVWDEVSAHEFCAAVDAALSAAAPESLALLQHASMQAAGGGGYDEFGSGGGGGLYGGGGGGGYGSGAPAIPLSRAPTQPSTMLPPYVPGGPGTAAPSPMMPYAAGPPVRSTVTTGSVLPIAAGGAASAAAAAAAGGYYVAGGTPAGGMIPLPPPQGHAQYGGGGGPGTGYGKDYQVAGDLSQMRLKSATGTPAQPPHAGAAPPPGAAAAAGPYAPPPPPQHQHYPPPHPPPPPAHLAAAQAVVGQALREGWTPVQIRQVLSSVPDAEFSALIAQASLQQQAADALLASSARGAQQPAPHVQQQQRQRQQQQPSAAPPPPAEEDLGTWEDVLDDLRHFSTAALAADPAAGGEMAADEAAEQQQQQEQEQGQGQGQRTHRWRGTWRRRHAQQDEQQQQGPQPMQMAGDDLQAQQQQPRDGSFATDWIPDLISRLESQNPGAGVAAAAAAAAATAAAAAATAAAGGSGHHGHGFGFGAAPGQRVKRERSNPQTAALAAIGAARAGGGAVSGVPGGGDGSGPAGGAAGEGELRSDSKGAFHVDSIGRHFPAARLSSADGAVGAGAQVANPWATGGAAGAAAGPPPPAGAIASAPPAGGRGSGGLYPGASAVDPSPFVANTSGSGDLVGRTGSGRMREWLASVFAPKRTPSAEAAEVAAAAAAARGTGSGGIAGIAVGSGGTPMDLATLRAMFGGSGPSGRGGSGGSGVLVGGGPSGEAAAALAAADANAAASR